MTQKLEDVRRLYLEGIRDGHAREAIEAYTGDRYTQHSTGVRDGVEGFVEFFGPFLERNPVREIERSCGPGSPRPRRRRRSTPWSRSGGAERVGPLVTPANDGRATRRHAGRWLMGRRVRSCHSRKITSPESARAAASRYTLTATPYASAAAGSYSLQLLVRPEPQRFDYTEGTVVGHGSPGTGAGNIENLAAEDVYSFRSPGGDRYSTAGRASAARSRPCARTAAPPSPAACAPTGLSAVWPRATTSWRSPAVRRRAVPMASNCSPRRSPRRSPPQDFAVSLPLTVSEGVPAAGAGSLETKQSVDRYTFTVGGTAPLYVDIQSCLDAGSLRWALRNVSAGSDVDSGDCTDHETAALPAGTYRLSVSSPGGGRGAAGRGQRTPQAPQTSAD